MTKNHQKIENNLPEKKAKEDVMSKCVTGEDGKIVLHERARVMASCACVIFLSPSFDIIFCGLTFVWLMARLDFGGFFWDRNHCVGGEACIIAYEYHETIFIYYT